METTILILIVAVALFYTVYIYGRSLKGLFFSRKVEKVRLACGHCVGCPSSDECSSKK
jgi:hypothetical protein